MGVYKRTDSATWWMSLQVEGKRVRMNTQVTNRKLAEEIFAAWQVEHARARWLGAPPADPFHTVHELLEEYEHKVTPRKSPTSQKRDKPVLEQFEQHWGKLTLAELSPKMIDDYLTDRLRQVSFATVSKELGILKAAYRCARRWGWTSAAPFSDMHLDQEGDERIRWLTEAEEKRLLDICSDWLRDFVVMGLDTGLRRTNLVGLQWDWVLPSATVLIIPKRHIKTKKQTVTIPLTTRARAVIQKQQRHMNTPWVFTQDNGAPYTLDQVGMAVVRAGKRAELPGISLHTLRHTFISRLVQEGRPLPEVAALAGHADIRMTMRYAHLAPQHLHQGIAALEARQIRQAHTECPDEAAKMKSVTLVSRLGQQVA